MTQIWPAKETQSWWEGKDGRQPLRENKTGRSGAGTGAGAVRGDINSKFARFYIILKQMSFKTTPAVLVNFHENANKRTSLLTI